MGVGLKTGGGWVENQHGRVVNFDDILADNKKATGNSMAFLRYTRFSFYNSSSSMGSNSLFFVTRDVKKASISYLVFMSSIVKTFE